ncbi:MAG TPA: tetratricopeptide repeat protein [Pirellulaceae bacterium]
MTTTIPERYRAAEKLKDEGKLDEAAAALTALLEEDPTHVLSHLALAVIYFRLRRAEDSVRHGQRACELDPHDPFNFTALSVTYQRAWQLTQNQRYIQLAEDAMAQAQTLEGRR